MNTILVLSSTICDLFQLSGCFLSAQGHMSLMSLLFTVTFTTEFLHKLPYVYLYLMINVALSSLHVKTLNILTFDSVGNFDLVKLHQFLIYCNKVHISG